MNSGVSAPLPERLLCIDPGTERSAWMVYDCLTDLPVEWAHQENAAVVRMVRGLFDPPGSPVPFHLVLETPQYQGQRAGYDLFETVFWVGRLAEASHGNYTRITPAHVRRAICGKVIGPDDAAIRATLVDMYGPGKERAIGRKGTPGPLYGVATHAWRALALAVTWRGERWHTTRHSEDLKSIAVPNMTFPAGP